MELRTALITGASSGIGEAVSRRLAKDGVEVVLAARRVDQLERVVQEIAREGGKARAVALDVADVGRTLEVIRRADDELGGLDLVIANAGVGRERWSGKLTPEDWTSIVDVNVRGAIATVTAIVDRMCDRKRGHIVGVSSLAQYRGLPRNAAYCGSKAFLSTFLESLRVDLRSCGVAVTDVRPGFVRTAMTQSNTSPMPWLVDADVAADVIARGIRRRKAVVAFPWQLATVVRSTVVLPAGIWDSAVSRARGRS